MNLPPRKKTTPSVSIIIPHYRQPSDLKLALDSVSAQDYRDYEVIVVDDCSGNEIVSSLNELLSSYPAMDMKLLSTEVNGGPGVARQVGVNAAQGKYLAFLDADDVWAHDKLVHQIAHLNASPHCFAVSGRVVHIKWKTDPGQGSIVYRQVKRGRWLYKNQFATSATVVRNENFSFPAGYRFAEDFAAWTSDPRILQASFKTDTVVGYRRKHPFADSGLSSNLAKMELGRQRALWKIEIPGVARVPLLATASLLSAAKFALRILRVVARRSLSSGK